MKISYLMLELEPYFLFGHTGQHAVGIFPELFQQSEVNNTPPPLGSPTGPAQVSGVLASVTTSETSHSCHQQGSISAA